jgi:protection-of-telomeres protein 1
LIIQTGKCSSDWTPLSKSGNPLSFTPKLTGTSLRRNSDQLQEVKTKLFCLWGDLEEQKSSLAKTRTPEPTSTADDPSSSPEPYQPGDQPPIDSDDEDEQHSPPRELGSNKPSAEDPTATSSPTELTIKNKPFTCCIRQYGVKIDEPDPAKATAGNGKRWERQFGLFGVRIM